MRQIREIEAEINRTQKNKATNYHIGLLKAKLSKLRSELLEGPKGSKGSGEGFDVMKSGDARVALIGFPSVGQSLSRLDERCLRETIPHAIRTVCGRRLIRRAPPVCA